MPLKYIWKFSTVVVLFSERHKVLKRLEEVFMSFIEKNVWIRDQIEIKKKLRYSLCCPKNHILKQGLSM